jgi:hypothetical protein
MSVWAPLNPLDTYSHLALDHHRARTRRIDDIADGGIEGINILPIRPGDLDAVTFKSGRDTVTFQVLRRVTAAKVSSAFPL